MKKIDEKIIKSYPIYLRGSMQEGFVAEVNDLFSCYGLGDSQEDALKDAYRSIKLWIEDAHEKGREVPKPSTEVALPSGKFNLRIPRSLHRQLIITASTEGVSLNGFTSSLLSWAVSASRYTTCEYIQESILVSTGKFATALDAFDAFKETLIKDSDLKPVTVVFPKLSAAS